MEAAGGDSLKALELMFDLEATLDRRISMRFIGPLTRPSHLIASLRSAEPVGGGAQRPKRAHSCSCCRGRSATLSAWSICRSFVGRHQSRRSRLFADDPAALQVIRFDDLVADVIQPIRLAAQRGEAVRVLGCSLGGLVAVEIARILAAEGHVIEFVGLVDTSTVPLRWNFDNTNPDRVPAHIAGQVNQPILARILRSTGKERYCG